MEEDLFKKLNPGQPIPPGCREIPGHIPHSYAKLYLHDPHRIAKLRSLEAGYKKIIRKEEINNYVIENEKRRAYGAWRAASDKKVLSRNVERDVEYLLAKRDEHLEERRDRLKQLFQEEEEKYLCELEQQGETPIQHYERMTRALAVLQAQKEEERLKVVKEKFEQRWREACPGLREMISKEICKEVAYERNEQLLHKEKIRQQMKEQEKMFAECYKADCEAKYERARLEEENAKKNALECALIQTAQYEESQRKSKELENLKREEAALMEQQRKLMELEKQWEHASKHNMQNRTRKGLDKCIIIKNKLAKEQKEREDLLDQFYLALSRTMDIEDTQKQTQKKKDLHYQQQEFMQYLTKVKEQERQRAMEIERLSKIANDEMWKQRQRQWDIEREAREKLTRKTYDGILEQIKCNLKLIEERRFEIQQERIEMDRKIEEYRHEEAEKWKKWREVQLHHQSSLLTQIKEEKRLQDEQEMEKKREWEQCRKEEEEYQNIMKALRDNPLAAVQTHPCRRNKFHIPITR